MNHVILLQFGGSVNEQFELVDMRPHVLTFKNTSSFNELVPRVRTVMNTRCDLRLHGRHDMEGNRPIYMMLSLGSEDECQLYKSCASQYGLKGAEVVGVIALLSAGEIIVHEDDVTMEETIADPITIEQPRQEELYGVTHIVSLTSELAHPLASDVIRVWFSHAHRLNQYHAHQCKLQHEEYNKCIRKTLSNNYCNKL
jgi:hypothetical protein